LVIYPAIDIIGGRCVRLTQGDYSRMETYSDDPLAVAMRFEETGAEYLHVVDLDGARYGKPLNLGTVSRIAVRASVPVQLGGGIRTIDDIQNSLSKGISRVILGTSAIKDPELVKEALDKFGEAIAIAIDAKQGKVAISGWEEISSMDAVDFAVHMENLGASIIIYTDVQKDGMLSGPNFEEIHKICSSVSISVIAAGGVSTIEDIEGLKKTGVHGAIIGKALYTGDISLRDALLAGE
jgi:phosphoribosylformimino-5-aminoimidazole carboxamide ribotide isomerase